MAVTLFMRIPELSPERYERVMEDLELDANPPAGMILHVASEAAGAVNVVEVWQTPEAAESYVSRRLRGALELHGVKEPLSYRIEPMQNLFSPEMDIVERIGATSLPGGLGARARAS
jgi:hypothetical protein